MEIPMFRDTRHIHFVAVGGIGMSGIAEILLNLGYRVSGSDLSKSSTMDRLSNIGVTVYIGHSAEQIAGADVVVYSSAVPESNPEIIEARRNKVPVIRRAEMLAELMRLKYGIAVAGSHGKTTTTSLIAEVLDEGNLDPTVVVGGRALATGANAVLGEGKYLVAEADESDGSFLKLIPTLAVVTNMDLEHVDFYPDMGVLRDAFRSFLEKVPFYGAAILCVDDQEVRNLIPGLDRKVITYGFSDDAEVRAVRIDSNRVTVFLREQKLGELSIKLPGDHNILNALAAVTVGMELGIEFGQIRKALNNFQGVSRRYERKGLFSGVEVIDDYGHHPTEILATLKVAAESGKRVVALFQPHRYSRTARFTEDFAKALSLADHVALLPVYAASETAPSGVGSHLIADAMERNSSKVDLLSGADELPGWLESNVENGDLLITLGAGDIGRLVNEIIELLDNRNSN
jgi:UDP-N-acetylmuramate--alanine ligase